MKRTFLSFLIMILTITIYADSNSDFINASKNGDITTLSNLLKSNIDIDCTDIDGKTTLMWASEKGYEEIVSLLLENSAKINLSEKSGYTALHYASQTSKIEVVKTLLAAEDNKITNSQANNGWTPLICATSMNHYDIVKLLIDNGADKTLKDKRGLSAKVYAQIMGTKELVKLFE